MADLATDDNTGPWTWDGQKGWLISPADELAVRLVTRAALAAIDERQAHFPTCVLCGARTRVLDRKGLCPRVTQAHLDYMPGQGVAW